MAVRSMSKYCGVVLAVWIGLMVSCCQAGEWAIPKGMVADGVGRSAGENYPGYVLVDPGEVDVMPVYVNQLGYDVDWPKRFTAPLAKDGSGFEIVDLSSGKTVFSGRVVGHVGDFSALQVDVKGRDYVVRVRGGNGVVGQSFPFRIEKELMATYLFDPAVRFMQDARSIIGTHPSAYGGCPWRDGTYYSYEVPSLVMLYLSTPDQFDSMACEIDYEKEKRQLFDTSFQSVSERYDDNATKTAKRYFNEIDPPMGKNVPDIIRLIHWGIGWYLLDPVTRDPSNDPLGEMIHPQTVEQFAYFLYGYPQYKQYFSDQFYQAAYEFAFSHWEDALLFEVDERIGTCKGRHCPGHSIMPNLMMYEVARRSGRSDANRYFDAALRQTQWVIDSMDWADPQSGKGQRMSEHKLVTGLAFFMKQYPKRTPAGLKSKLNTWARVMIGRSENMWDFRRYNEKEWALPGRSADGSGGDGWNDVGNVAGFTGCCFAVAEVLEDKALQQRLREIGVAHFDTLFGRNPLGAHAAYAATDRRYGFIGADCGWPEKFGDDQCARLELVRGVLNCSCGTIQYPYNPVFNFRHTEGWVAFNAAWNVSLSYSCEYLSENSFKP